VGVLVPDVDEIVAVKVTVEPLCVAVSVVVEAVVPPPDGACQKSPQPARNGVAESVSSMIIIPALLSLSFIESPFLVPEA
jgi:hypothetical protein